MSGMEIVVNATVWFMFLASMCYDLKYQSKCGCTAMKNMFDRENCHEKPSFDRCGHNCTDDKYQEVMVAHNEIFRLATDGVDSNLMRIINPADITKSNITINIPMVFHIVILIWLRKEFNTGRIT